MNYDLEKTVQSPIEYSLDSAMKYGDMPQALLMSKFEETDMGSEENLYDNYVRAEIMDRTPDKSKFEHEEPRRNTSYGKLNLLYNGTRGEVDTPYRPEYFDGFMGPEDRDPRGIATDPDFKQLKSQHQARNRFVRFSADSTHSITGLGRSEEKVMKDKQTINKYMKQHMKFFNRQLDGRREGLRRDYQHKSNIPKQVVVQSYGDMVKDYALNPQKRLNVVCERAIRNSKEYLEETNDADFQIAKYSQICRQSRKNTTFNPAAHGNADGEFKEESRTKSYKAVSLLMADIVRCKSQSLKLMKRSDADMGKSVESVARKTEMIREDIMLVTRAMAQDGEFGQTDHSLALKSAVPVQGEHLARQAVYNHSTPAHHLLNAEVIYKSLKEGDDLSKIKNKTIINTNARELKEPGAAKSAKKAITTGRKLDTKNEVDFAESSRTHNYKRAKVLNGDRRTRLVATDAETGESDNTQDRKCNSANYRNPDVRDVENNIEFSNNTSKERLIRGVGSKYLNRWIDRDQKDDEISFSN